jgi:hypothetical protein
MHFVAMRMNISYPIVPSDSFCYGNLLYLLDLKVVVHAVD